MHPYSIARSRNRLANPHRALAQMVEATRRIKLCCAIGGDHPLKSVIASKRQTYKPDLWGVRPNHLSRSGIQSRQLAKHSTPGLLDNLWRIGARPRRARTSATRDKESRNGKEEECGSCAPVGERRDVRDRYRRRAHALQISIHILIGDPNRSAGTGSLHRLVDDVILFTFGLVRHSHLNVKRQAEYTTATGITTFRTAKQTNDALHLD